jgi:Rhodanese-like domain
LYVKTPRYPLGGLLEEGRQMRLQWVVSVVLALVLVAGFSLGSQAAMPPGSDLPIELIGVKQVSQLLSDGAPVLLVDVRSRQDYLIRHIKGAVSIPVDSIEMRSREIPRDGIVVLY